MAVPKKRKSKSKTRMRRANHDKVSMTNLNGCSNCGEPKRSHRVCMSCGHYRGRQVLAIHTF